MFASPLPDRLRRACLSCRRRAARGASPAVGTAGLRSSRRGGAVPTLRRGVADATGRGGSERRAPLATGRGRGAPGSDRTRARTRPARGVRAARRWTWRRAAAARCVGAAALGRGALVPRRCVRPARRRCLGDCVAAPPTLSMRDGFGRDGDLARRPAAALASAALASAGSTASAAADATAAAFDAGRLRQRAPASGAAGCGGRAPCGDGDGAAAGAQPALRARASHAPSGRGCARPDRR